MVNNSKINRCLFGAETELALHAESIGTTRPVPADLAAAIIEDVADRYTHLPSPQPPPHRRVFLANGGCLYTDQGFHPELATAECSNPIELAAQTLALRNMLVESTRTIAGVYGVPIRLVANNCDYALGRPRTYGHHLNVLVSGVSLEHTVRQLAPLLAVMPVIAGAGKVSFMNLASGFELSQRAAYMSFLLGKRTTDGSRAMVTQKDEPLSNNGLRLHLISLDTTISPWQLVLVPAIIALSLKVIESGEDIARNVTLANPIRALQTVSCDPSLTAELPLADGSSTTALDILDTYREAVERPAHRLKLPDWTAPIVKAWGDVANNLRINPFREHRLDWVRKLLAFTNVLRRERLSWADFSKWKYVLASVRRLKATFPELDPLRLTTSATARAGIRRSALGVLERHLAKNELSWKDFPRIWQAVSRLCSVCLEYHTLRRSRYDDPCSLLTEEMIHGATTMPPKGTRAEVRGKAIREASKGATAWWTHVSTGNRRLMMPDAFGENASWQREQETQTKEHGDGHRNPGSSR